MDSGSSNAALAAKVPGNTDLLVADLPESEAFGRVAYVCGSQVVALIEGRERSDPLRLQMGSLVKTESADSTVFGVVSSLSIPLPAEDPAQKDVLTIEVELLGEVPKSDSGIPQRFRRGVSYPPLLNDLIFTTTRQDLGLVYARPNASTAVVGTIHQDRKVPSYIITNDLLGKHFAIVGTTGCGKSCATALILHAIIEKNPKSHIVLLDPHNEYSKAFGESAEVLDTSSLEIPYWMLEFNELLGIITGAGHEADKAEVAILSEAIPVVKAQYLKNAETVKQITVDTPIPYRLTDLIQFFDQAMGKLDKAEGLAPYQRLKSRIIALQGDPRYSFMFGGMAVRDNMEKILSRIFRIPVDGKPISILDLSGVPSEIVNVVVSVLCRITFDFALCSNREIPVLLVCEEAHRYASRSKEPGFEPTRRALSRIAKEGRKYGVSLCLVSQRPSELATGILSQCNTIFAMRMTNESDQEIMQSIISDSSLGFAEALPSLGNAEAIAVGEGIAVPMRLCFLNLPEVQRPRSETADFASAWQSDNYADNSVAEIVKRWRTQSF